MKKYEKYREVGLPWLKEVPEGWDVDKLKRKFYIDKDLSDTENPVVLSLARDGIKIRDITNNQGQMAASYKNYNKVEKGDLLLNPMDLYSGANCNVSYVEGVISPAYIKLRKKEELCERYFDYWFKLQYTSLAFQAVGKGVSKDNRWTLTNETLMNYQSPIPPLHEQEHIANFLDWKISEIDRLIELEKEKIQRIKEYYDRLNESYFEEIERNYDEIIKIRNFAKLQNGISESGAFFLKGKPFINYSDVFNNDVLPNQFENVADSNKKQQELFSVRKGDLFITRTSETVEDAASVCLCKETVNKAVFSGFLIRLRAFNSIFSDEFLLYYLKSMVVRNQIISNLNIVTRVSVSQNLIKNINLKIVPSEVQESVVKNINKNNINKNKIIELYIKNISYLEELKQILISDAVTGKIDVRNIEIPDYTHGKEEA